MDKIDQLIISNFIELIKPEIIMLKQHVSKVLVLSTELTNSQTHDGGEFMRITSRA